MRNSGRSSKCRCLAKFHFDSELGIVFVGEHSDLCVPLEETDIQRKGYVMKNLQSPEKQSGFEDLAVTCLSDWGSSSSNVTQIIEKEVTKKSNPGVLTYWADDCRRPNQTAPWHAFQQLRQETDRQLTSTTDTTTLTATWRSNLFKYRMGTHSDSARQSKHSRGGREGYHRCRVLDPVRIRALRRTFAELRLKCQ